MRPASIFAWQSTYDVVNERFVQQASHVLDSFQQSPLLFLFDIQQPRRAACSVSFLAMYALG
jgi:hypothetical protein